MEENKDKKSLSGKLQLKNLQCWANKTKLLTWKKQICFCRSKKKKEHLPQSEKKTETDDKIKSDVQSFEKDEQLNLTLSYRNPPKRVSKI